MTDERPSWEPGQEPWIRSALNGPAVNAGGYAQCYFCGGQTAKLSEGDLSTDPGRVEIYCNNTWCEAREVAVIILRDGKNASLRADVRMLHAIETDNHTTVHPPMQAMSLAELSAKVSHEQRGALQRRTDDGPADYAAPGVWNPDESGPLS